MLGRSDSDDRTLENPPFTQSILEIQFSNNGVAETSTTSQDSLGHLPPSVLNLQPSLIPETSEPLPTAKEVCKTSESALGALEPLPSFLEALRHLNSDQCTLGPSVYDQGNLEPSTPLHNTIGNPKPSPSVLEPISSTQKGVGTFFSTELLGLSTCAHDDFIPIHSHRDRLRYSFYPNKSHRCSNSTKKIASHTPFPEGDIRYSLLELDALRSFPSAKSRLTSSIYVRKDSSSTSTPPRSVSPPESSELTFRSSSPPKEDLRCSPSPRGSSRHLKSKKTKLKQAPKESGLKSVPSEDEGLKFHHSPTRIEASECKSNKESLEKSNRSSGHSSEHQKWTSSNLSALNRMTEHQPAQVESMGLVVTIASGTVTPMGQSLVMRSGWLRDQTGVRGTRKQRLPSTFCLPNHVASSIVHILVTDSGTRLPSSLDPNEEERVQGALLIQKAWMFAWLVHAELTAETARDWPVQARGHPFQVQLSSSVRFLRPTVTRVLCASATGHVHSSREAEPLSEDIALLLLAESHQWQPPRPGTLFSGPRPGSPFWVPQWDDDILSQWGKRFPHRPGTPFRGRRPGTPFSVSQGIDDSAPQWKTYLTSTKFPRDFAPPGVLRLARQKFRCQKPYKDKTAKIPYAGTADSLRSLRALIKITSSKRTLGPLKELKEMKKGQVLLPPEVPDCRSNPLSREPRPSVLPPATRKRGASTSVHRPRKVQRILDMSTVFEEPTDFDHSGTRGLKKKKIPPSLSYSGHLPNLPEDEENSSPEQEILEHVLPAQGSLEASCSPGVPLPKPSLFLEIPLDLSIPTQGNTGTSQSALSLQRFLPCTHKYLESSSSAFEPLEHLPVAPKARGLSTLSQETPSPLLPVHGTLELPQYGSEAVPSMPSVQGLQGSLSPLEGSIASVLSVHGSLGHSLSAQDSTEIYKSTKATPGQFLSSLDDMSHFMSSQETLGSLSSVEVDVGTYSHNTGSPGQLKNISGFPGSMISDHDPVLISLPVQGTLRHLPSAKEHVGLSLSTQQPPELSTLEQGSIQKVEASKVALVNPSSPKRATGKLQCAQYALEHLPPSEGALQHSSTHQGTQESLKSSLESLEILSSNSEHVKNSLSATGGLESSLSGSRVLGYELADKHSEQHSIYSEQGSLGNPLSTQEVQEHLVPLKGNLKSCQSAKEGPKTLIPSQIVLESVPSISEDLEALSSALERMRLSSLANESLENSQYAESVVESSSPATGTLRTTFAQKSLENSLPGKGMKEILSSSQGALEISSIKGRVENASSLERSMKPPASLQEPSRPYSLIQGTHQHPLPAQGLLGPVQTDSGIHGTFLTPEAGGNLSREPGSCKSFPLTPESLDHLQSAEGPDDLSISAHEMFDSLPLTQGTLGIVVYSSGLMAPSESEHRTLGHVSSVGKDGEISPFEKPTKSTSPLTPYLPFNREHDQMEVGILPALHGDLEASQSDQRTVEMTKIAEGTLENVSFAQRTTKLSTCSQEANKSSLSDQGHLLHSAHVKEALIPALSDQETKESLLSPSKDTEHPPSSVSVQMQQPSLSTRGPQDSLLTPPKPRKLSISVSDSLCPLTSSQESGTETVALSTLSLEYLEPIQSAQGELEYFSTIEQGNKHSSTASKTTRKLFSPQECGGHLSSDPSVQEPFQSGPMDVATFLSSQEPQKPFKLTEALLYPSTSGQECQEQSETSQDVMGTHKSSESIHGYILPEVEPVVTFTAVSGTKVTSPSAPQPLKLSSLLHVTSATSLTDQRVVGPRPPSQRTLEVLSLEQGMLEPLASPQGNERNSQIEQDTVEQSFSVQGILGSSPRTTGVLQSSPYAHKLPEIVSSTQKDALSLKESLFLPISTNRTFENLQSDCELTKHSNSFQEASRHSLLVQGPLQESPSASETLSPSFKQGITKSLLSSTVYSSKVLRQHQYSQNTLGHLSCGREGMESSQSATKSIESLPPPLVVPRGHLTSTKGSEEAFPAGQGNLDPHKPSQGPLEHVTSPQEMLHSAQFAEWTLQVSTHSKAVPEPYTNSQFTQKKKTLKMSKSTQGALESSSASQGTGEFISSAKDKSLDLSVSAQGTLVTLLCNQGTRKHPASSQNPQNTSQSVQNSLQYPPSVPGSLKPSQSEKSTLGSLSSPAGIGISSPGSQEMFQLSASSGHPEPLLYFGLPLELSMCAQGTLCPFSSPQGELDPLHCFSGNLESSQPAQMNASHVSSVREPVGNSPSVPDPREPSPFITKCLEDFHHTSRKNREGLLDVHGAQQLQAHSPGYLGHCQYTPQSSETLTSPQMVFKCSESSSQTLETLPPLPGTLGHSLSSQSAVFPFDSDQQIQESSSSLQKSVQFSPSSKGSLRPTPSVLGTSQSLLSAQSCPKLSMYAQGVLGSSPPQQGCLGDSLSMQGALGTSISAQEIVGHSKSDQESPEMFISSQENPGPSLFQEALVHSSSLPQDCGLSQSSRDMLGTSLSIQGARRTPSSVQVSIVTVPLAQSVLEFQTSLEHTLGTSQLASETTKPLPSSEEVYSILKSLSRSIETLTSILETLTFSTFAKGAASPSKTDQVILRSPRVSHKTLEFSPSDQQSVKTASSQMRPDRTSLTDKGLQEISSGEKVPLGDSPLQQICSGNALSKQGDLGLPISAQEALGYPPSAPGSPDSSLPPEEASGTCLEQGHLGKSLSLSDLGDLELSEYSQGH
ncbi:hypothetical protein ACRRTK_025047 [Alexandromys fortis]